MDSQGKSGPSPDVANDGSVVEEQDVWDKTDDNSAIVDLTISFEAIYISIKSYVRMLIAMAGLGIVFIGCYNLFGPLVIGSEYLVDAHHVMEPVAYQRQNSPIKNDYYLIYISDLLCIAVGGLIAWFG